MRLMQWRVESLDSIDSTNSELLRRAQAGEDLHGKVLTATHQTAGRGQHGRVWVNTPGASLLMSVAYEFPKRTTLSGLSLLLGLAVHEALLGLQLRTQLKWPNDVLLQGKKLAGLLVECRGTLAVMGIGINHTLSAAHKAREPNAIDLSEWLPALSLSALRDAVLAQLSEVLPVFTEQGFAVFQLRWQKAHLYHEQKVQLLLPDGRELQAKVLGVDALGALKVASAQGIEYVHSATLRPC
jgi:BirA family biotin operon repressor/biotin-[acetyl-CoA-carboxylase] ligase